MLILLSVIVSCIVSSQSETSSLVTPCRSDDKPCIISSGQALLQRAVNGVPEFDMPPFDPLFVDSVRNDDVDLKLGFRNINVYGIGKCKFNDISRDLKKQTVTTVVECPMKASGQYDLKGKLLFFEVFGDGDFEIKTKNVRLTVTQKLKTITGADGKPHWKATGFDYSYDLIEKVDIDIKNLFNGDETRAKPIVELINNSWKDIVDEIGGPIIKQLINKGVNICNQLFSNLPIEKLEIA